MTINKLWKKIKNKLFKLLIRVQFDLDNSDEAMELNENYRYFQFLSRKYKRFLARLPEYKGTHEYSNVVWWCWLQGEENAPELCRACLNSLRENLKGYEIVVITKDNYKEYVNFPKYILEKYDAGDITNTHFSDLLRVQLLVEHGGTWIDSSVLCTGYDENYFNKDLFAFSNFMQRDASIKTSSWFISAEKGSPVLKTTRDLLFEYWKDNDILCHYFLLHMFFTMGCNKYPELWERVDTFSNIPPHVLQFELNDKFSKERFAQIKGMSSIHKLSQKIKITGGEYSNYDYIIERYLGAEVKDGQ